MSDYDVEKDIEGRLDSITLDIDDMRQNFNSQYLRLEDRLNKLAGAIRAIEDHGQRLSLLEQTRGMQ